MRAPARLLLTALATATLGGCAVVSVAGAAVSVGATAVSVGASAVGLAADAAIGGARLAGKAVSAATDDGDGSGIQIREREPQALPPSPAEAAPAPAVEVTPITPGHAPDATPLSP